MPFLCTSRSMILCSFIRKLSQAEFLIGFDPLIVVLITFPWWWVMLSIFSCWWSARLPWKNVYLDPMIFFPMTFLIGLYELFIYFGYQLRISHSICKYLLPFSKLSFFFFFGGKCFPSKKQKFWFDVVLFVYFCFCYPYHKKRDFKKLLKFILETVFLIFSSSLWFQVLHLSF